MSRVRTFILFRLSEVQDMRYARIALLLAAAACSMAIATPAPTQAASTAASANSNSAAAAPKMRHTRRRFMQAQIDHRRPTQDDLRPTRDDFQEIEKDNQDLDLPASQDDIIGAGGVHSREEDLAKEIEQLGPWNGRQISDICPSCGGAVWDVMRGEARVTHRLDRRYDHLAPSRNQILRRNPTLAP
jgi:hypothetical protein